MSYVQFNKDVIGYKKVVNKGKQYIITLLIPKHTTIHSGMLGEVDVTRSRNARWCNVVDTIGTTIEAHAKLCGMHNTARSGNLYKRDYLGLCTMDLLPYRDYKCRSECAEVLEIRNMKTGKLVDEICNEGDGRYVRELLYEVGEMVYPHEFGTYQDDGSHPPFCYGGIHFFPEQWMAEEY